MHLIKQQRMKVSGKDHDPAYPKLGCSDDTKEALQGDRAKASTLARITFLMTSSSHRYATTLTNMLHFVAGRVNLTATSD